jgi:hypothetical protein
MTAPLIASPAVSLSEWLNSTCFCLTLDRAALYEAIDREMGDPQFCATHMDSRTRLFSNVPVFLSSQDLEAMTKIVETVETATQLPSYREAALAWAPEIARFDPGPAGAFMGYDFHLGTDGPKLIEINTNAGGAFLNAALARAQRACCPQVEEAFILSDIAGFDERVIGMFRQEWARQRASGMPSRIAIIDDDPQDQYLFPEFLLARQTFLRHGIDAVVADPRSLRYESSTLLCEGKPVDLVYNRLVDFALALPGHEALRMAWLDGAAVVTPNPHNHALFADKRNLTLLSDASRLAAWGLAPHLAAEAARIPRAVEVTAENSAVLWERRKQFFFKPAGGHGGKAVYRGDKLTKGVWQTIVHGRYIAQELAPPGERMVRLDGSLETRKADIRLYTYDGHVLLAAARLYQGQTTNFRTPGGGFASVFFFGPEARTACPDSGV